MSFMRGDGWQRARVEQGLNHSRGTIPAVPVQQRGEIVRWRNRAKDRSATDHRLRE